MNSFLENLVHLLKRFKIAISYRFNLFINVVFIFLLTFYFQDSISKIQVSII